MKPGRGVRHPLPPAILLAVATVVACGVGACGTRTNLLTPDAGDAPDRVDAGADAVGADASTGGSCSNVNRPSVVFVGGGSCVEVALGDSVPVETLDCSNASNRSWRVVEMSVPEPFQAAVWVEMRSSGDFAMAQSDGSECPIRCRLKGAGFSSGGRELPRASTGLGTVEGGRVLLSPRVQRAFLCPLDVVPVWDD